MIKQYKIICTILFFVLFLSGCAATGINKQYLTNNTKFKVKSVVVSARKNGDDDKKLSLLLSTMVTTKLQNKLSSNSYFNVSNNNKDLIEINILSIYNVSDSTGRVYASSIDFKKNDKSVKKVTVTSFNCKVEKASVSSNNKIKQLALELDNESDCVDELVSDTYTKILNVIKLSYGN